MPTYACGSPPVPQPTSITTLAALQQSYSTLTKPPQEFDEGLKSYAFKNSRVQNTDELGFGMGLYIVKEIVSAHKGSIDVESEIGEGAEFRILLPRHPRFD